MALLIVRVTVAGVLVWRSATVSEILFQWILVVGGFRHEIVPVDSGGRWTLTRDLSSGFWWSGEL